MRPSPLSRFPSPCLPSLPPGIRAELRLAGSSCPASEVSAGKEIQSFSPKMGCPCPEGMLRLFYSNLPGKGAPSGGREEALEAGMCAWNRSGCLEEEEGVKLR